MNYVIHTIFITHQLRVSESTCITSCESHDILVEDHNWAEHLLAGFLDIMAR